MNKSPAAATKPAAAVKAAAKAEEKTSEMNIEPSKEK